MPLTRSPSTAHLEILGGIVTSASITDATGTRSDPAAIGRYRFFVDAVENDGARCSLWDGSSYDEAIRQAHHLSPDFGPIHDLIAGESND